MREDVKIYKFKLNKSEQTLINNLERIMGLITDKIKSD